MIPEKIAAYRSICPMLDEVTNWQLLRKWALSEVYRATLSSGKTRIVNWGGMEMAGEAAIYGKLLTPLRIRAPHIYGSIANERGGLMIMEDAGACNLEQQPNAAAFIEAARELARLRAAASVSLSRGDIGHRTLQAYAVPAEHLLNQLDELIAFGEQIGYPDAAQSILRRAKDWLPGQLVRLVNETPITIVHHDYHAKNLVIQQHGRIMPIDWSNAYLSPLLGDLYCLLTEARSYANVPKRTILEVFLTEMVRMEKAAPELASLSTLPHLVWQVRTGGVCWLIRTLRWLVFGGIETIPGSEAWVSDLMEDIGALLEGLDVSDGF